MKIGALVFASLSLAACGTTTPELTNVPTDRCETTSCFNQLQIRNVEVVDNTTLVIYVGNQNCPFVVEFSGTFCDLTFLPGSTVTFRPDTFRAQRETDTLMTRICSRDSNVGIDEGPFTTAAGGDTAENRIPCRIQNVASLTDDELLELYVDRRITPPPPPFGTGRITVPEESAETEPGGSDTTAPEGEGAQSPPEGSDARIGSAGGPPAETTGRDAVD
jgi:hypothetical protein